MITPNSDLQRIDEILGCAPVLPVLTVHEVEHAVPLAEALRDAGLPVLEVTLRTDCALDVIRTLRDQVDGIVVGAGTILSGADLERVAGAGAEFAISPGATPALYEAAESVGMPFIPAVATASELLAGMEAGYRRFKFFPAEASGGVAALKSFAGPFAEARFCPTGGIGPGNAAEYLRLGNVMTVGGSWMVPADAIETGDWDRVKALARGAVNLLV